MQLIEIYLIAAGAVLLALGAYLSKRRKTGPEPAPDEGSRLALSVENAARLETSLTQLLQELHNLSRDMTTDLEQKLAELKEMLQLADKKLEEIAAAEVEEQPTDRPTMEQEEEREDSPKPFEEELQLTIEDNFAPQPPPDRYREIYEMAEQGLPIDEIARRMQMGKGEIQLILSLREKD
ncbi:MAG: hypothetical protein HQ583_10485 [Candidatus Abyssubacteria bacterium]|nr:hypothetical protein [Candidatus Abyssubacteria bacterium]